MTSAILTHEELLRNNGLNITSNRLSILSAIKTNPHSTADEIINFARTTTPTLSRQAVFDALNIFTEKGIIRRIQPASSPALYEDRVDDNHHHVVCRTCGATADVDCALGKRPCLDASNEHGFSIDEAEVIYWGTCPQCQTQNLSKESKS